ncbi:hypothetical protein ACLOJK_018330 [Asimina triloba]
MQPSRSWRHALWKPSSPSSAVHDAIHPAAIATSSRKCHFRQPLCSPVLARHRQGSTTPPSISGSSRSVLDPDRQQQLSTLELHPHFFFNDATNLSADRFGYVMPIYSIQQSAEFRSSPPTTTATTAASSSVCRSLDQRHQLQASPANEEEGAIASPLPAAVSPILIGGFNIFPKIDRGNPSAAVACEEEGGTNPDLRHCSPPLPDPLKTVTTKNPSEPIVATDHPTV